MDLCSRRVIGWAMESHMRAELVCQALIMAQGQRNPAEGVLLHSDRGSQYASEEYQALLKKHKMVCSMSRKRKLLGQRADGALLPEFEDGAGMAQRLRQTRKKPAGMWQTTLLTFYNQKRLNSALGNIARQSLKDNASSNQVCAGLSGLTPIGVFEKLDQDSLRSCGEFLRVPRIALRWVCLRFID